MGKNQKPTNTNHSEEDDLPIELDLEEVLAPKASKEPSAKKRKEKPYTIGKIVTDGDPEGEEDVSEYDEVSAESAEDEIHSQEDLAPLVDEEDQKAGDDGWEGDE